MSLFDDIKAKADQNGDGKVTKDDLDALRGNHNSDIVDKLKKLADRNSDGKLNLDDAKNFDLGDVASDIKNKLF